MVRCVDEIMITGVNGRILFERPADVESAAVGKVDVEQRQLGLVGRTMFTRAGGGGCLDHTITFLSQDASSEKSRRIVVVYVDNQGFLRDQLVQL